MKLLISFDLQRGPKTGLAPPHFFLSTAL